MGKSKVLEWDKEGDGIRQVRFSDELPSGVTLSAPTVAVQKRTVGSDPEDWNTAVGVTVSGEVVVNAMDDADPPVLIATDQAVQFQINQDTDPQPDETDDPVPGDNYRVVIKADRSDAGDVVGKPPLRIMP